MLDSNLGVNTSRIMGTGMEQNHITFRNFLQHKNFIINITMEQCFTIPILLIARPKQKTIGTK